MPKLTVDGIEVEVPDGATVLQACEAAGKEIPRFCYHERLSIAGNCRMCLVEMENSPKPVASCAMPAADGQVIHTDSEKTRRAREGVMEFLLINHPLDCPICDEGGECDLQDQAMVYGKGSSRFAENKRAVTEKYMGPLIKTVMTRCIHCTRCVRFVEEIGGDSEIGALNRGEDMQITSYLEQAVTTELSGNVIDLCPVGALTSKPIAFQSRPWELKRTDGIDVTDAIGANIVIGTRSGAVVRVTPRANDEVNEEWISDRARFSADGLKERRLDRPWVRRGGKLQPASWADAFAAVKEAVTEGDVGALAGDLSALEDMVAAKDLLAALGSNRLESRLDGSAVSGPRGSWRSNTPIADLPNADFILLVGLNPRVDAPLLTPRLRQAVRYNGASLYRVGPADELYIPTNELGDDLSVLAKMPSEVDEALSKAERPVILIGGRNTSADVLGAVYALAPRFQKDGWNGFNIVPTAASRIGALEIGFTSEGGLEGFAACPPKTLFLLGVDEIDLSPFTNSTIVYVGSHGDQGAAAADIILPAAAWPEKPGTYVNMEGRVQRSLRATFPPGEAREDWTIFRALSEVLGARLAYDDINQLRARIASEWPHLGEEGLTAVAWEQPTVSGSAAPSGPVRVAERSFYLSNPIARASKTMAQCIEEIVEGRKPQAEAVE